MSNIINIPSSNKAQEELDRRIAEAIVSRLMRIKTHRLTVADIVGVLRVIELRVLLK